MDNHSDNLIQFMLRYSVYGIVPGMWFAYIGGVSPWYGAVAGLALTFMVGLPSRLLGGRKDQGPNSQQPF